MNFFTMSKATLRAIVASSPETRGLLFDRTHVMNDFNSSFKESCFSILILFWKLPSFFSDRL